MMICSYWNAEAFTEEYEEMEALMQEMIDDDEFMVEFAKEIEAEFPTDEEMERMAETLGE